MVAESLRSNHPPPWMFELASTSFWSGYDPRWSFLRFYDVSSATSVHSLLPWIVFDKLKQWLSFVQVGIGFHLRLCLLLYLCLYNSSDKSRDSWFWSVSNCLAFSGFQIVSNCQSFSGFRIVSNCQSFSYGLCLLFIL